MTPVITNDTSRAGYKALRVGGKYPRLAPAADDEFEQDWDHTISGNELILRVHRHIDELYAQDAK